MRFYIITEFIFIKLKQLIMHNIDLYKILGFSLNDQQKNAIVLLEDFCKKDNQDDVFILKGSAGTGKTSIVKALTTILSKKCVATKICAPTARAANIISNKTSHLSKTIHSEIYFPFSIEGGGVEMIRKDNQSNEYTVFIIDESSMISNTINNSNDFIVSRPLLEELIDYVKQGNNKNKLIFIGDKFQLPPIKETTSPALSKNFLEKFFSIKAKEYELTKVMRQGEGCKVLSLATEVRDNMIEGRSTAKNLDIDRSYFSTGAMLEYLRFYNPDKIDAITMICASNKNVDNWNRWIREKLGFYNHFLNIGEFIITQENWINSKGEFIYKGEFGKVISIDNNIKEYAGVHFVNVEIEFPTSEGSSKIISAKILVEAINTTYGKLSADKESVLYAQVMKQNKKFRESLNKSDDEYLGAMRLKYAYAITCHKAQGGEWDNVLIHPWRLGTDLSWTYTAITRARKHVFSYAS
jgi:exodeoxyribonuclease-5